LRRASGEINLCAVAFDPDAHPQRARLVRHPIVVKRVFRFVDSIGNRCDAGAHHPRRVSDEVRRILARFTRARAFHDLQQARRSRLQRSGLRREIRTPLLCAAHVRQQEAQHVFIHAPAAHEMDGRDAQALAINVRRHAHRAGAAAADVRMMRPTRHVKKRAG
jgi:hypothetical protein